MLQLPEAQLGSNANQHLHDIYSHCQSGTCLFSERCILNWKIKMNRWRWEMMSSRAKPMEKILAIWKWGWRAMDGGTCAVLADGGAGDPQPRCGTAGMQRGAQSRAPLWQRGVGAQGRLVPSHPSDPGAEAPFVPTASLGWSHAGSSAQREGRCPGTWGRLHQAVALWTLEGHMQTSEVLLKR